ncbi:cupin domain-containing protein [Rathayibacter sp. YIM 133350]|uniref:cupin domain-containing protein n=1 Tax=Rathayibacter sp. YIM 133350 TaxID=3131992 RepID=UPI00307E9D8B
MGFDERGPVSRPALSRCINVSAETFAADYWSTQPLLSRAETLREGGDGGFGDGGFGDLFSTDAVDELVSRRGVRTPFIRMAHEGRVLKPADYTAPGGFGAEVADQVSSDKVLAQFADGATIVLQGLHRLWPPLIDFTRRLIDDIGHPAQVNAYVTPPSSQGFDPHYDTHDVFVLQVSGEKHWRIHAPVHPDPLADQPWGDHREAVERAAQGAPVIDEVLRPGDALYLPRGWIHSAIALGATSVHLTIGMSAYTRADVVDALVSIVGQTPELRTSLPLGVDLDDEESLRPIVDATVRALLATLSDAGEPGTASAPARQAVAGRLSTRLRNATRAEPMSPLATLDAIAALGAASVVRWRGSLPARLDEQGDRVRLSARGRSLALPVEAVEALRALVSGEPVAVGELPGLDLESAIVVVRRLLREGFVVSPA